MSQLDTSTLVNLISEFDGDGEFNFLYKYFGLLMLLMLSIGFVDQVATSSLNCVLKKPMVGDTIEMVSSIERFEQVNDKF